MLLSVVSPLKTFCSVVGSSAMTEGIFKEDARVEFNDDANGDRDYVD